MTRRLARPTLAPWRSEPVPPGQGPCIRYVMRYCFDNSSVRATMRHCRRLSIALILMPHPSRVAPHVVRTCSPSRTISRAGNAGSEVELIRASGLFDAVWYCETYPDILAAGAEPVEHFANWGWREGPQSQSLFRYRLVSAARIPMSPAPASIRWFTTSAPARRKTVRPARTSTFPGTARRHPPGTPAARCWRISWSAAAPAG